MVELELAAVVDVEDAFPPVAAAAAAAPPPPLLLLLLLLLAPFEDDNEGAPFGSLVLPFLTPTRQHLWPHVARSSQVCLHFRNSWFDDGIGASSSASIADGNSMLPKMSSLSLPPVNRMHHVLSMLR